jgi:hypothetical protein
MGQLLTLTTSGKCFSILLVGAEDGSAPYSGGAQDLGNGSRNGWEAVAPLSNTLPTMFTFREAPRPEMEDNEIITLLPQ